MSKTAQPRVRSSAMEKVSLSKIYKGVEIEQKFNVTVKSNCNLWYQKLRMIYSIDPKNSLCQHSHCPAWLN